MIGRESEFQIRTAKSRRQGSSNRRAQKFVSQVLRGANRSGRAVRAGHRSRSTGSTFGRGRAAALQIGKLSSSRRVIVKTRVVRHTGSNAKAAGLSVHIKYLERDGIGQDGKDPAMFDALGDDVDADSFAERCKDDRHHFRFMLSPEDAVRLGDLKETTRELMSQMENDLGTKLDWQAVDHWNTDNPHAHILVRGVDDIGKDLVIARDYISNGMRGRAEQLVSMELGPRSEKEIANDLTGQVKAERWTKLDYNLVQRYKQGIVDLRDVRKLGDKNYAQALIGRAQQLEKMGLADSLEPGRWSLNPDMEVTLRDLGMRGDIIKTMHRAMKGSGRGPSVSEFRIANVNPEKPVVGKFVERGLHDELTGEAFAIVAGVDGRSHYLRFGKIDLTSDAKAGAIVETRSWKDGEGRAGFALAVRSDHDLAAQVKSDGATWIDRQLVAQKRSELGGGFGNQVAAAMEKRIDHLEGRRLAKRRGGQVTFARRLIGTLRDQELQQTSQVIEKETGMPYRPTGPGEYLNGTYAKRLQLASGRFAMIESLSEGGKSFELVPWKPSMEKQIGKPMQGHMMSGGRVDWQLGRNKTLSR